ncbi:MAG: hypothetical protein WBG46_03265 [Nonlabens sp.]
MANKKKGQLTKTKSWDKHLRKFGRRLFWKSERPAEKKMIEESLSEWEETRILPLLTFDELFDVIEEKRLENQKDEKIAIKIQEAENDWSDKDTPIINLNEFLYNIEKEIGGVATRKSLRRLLRTYNLNPDHNNVWKAESVCYLIEIFEFTTEIELREVFLQLIETIKTGKSNYE